MTYMKKKLLLPVLSMLLALALIAAAMPAALAAEADVTDVSVPGTHALTISPSGVKNSFTLTATVTAPETLTVDTLTLGNVVWSLGNTADPVISLSASSSAVDLTSKTATVTVTAVKAGTDTVTATINGHSDVCSVTVTQDKEPATVAVNNGQTVAFNSIGQTQTVSSTITPTGLAGTYTWSVGSGLTIVGDYTGTNLPSISVKSTGATTSSQISLRFVPDSSTNYTEGTGSATATVTNNAPSMSIALAAGSNATLTASSQRSAVNLTLANMTSGEWTYEWKKGGTSGVISTTTTSTGCTVTPLKNGTATLQCVAKKTGATDVVSNTLSFTVNFPEPTLTVELSHSTLSLNRPKTAVTVTLTNDDSHYEDDDRIHWVSDDTSVARISASSKYLIDGKAEATVSARGNGTTYIRAYMYEDGGSSGTKLVGRVKITVKDYKAIPQSGQDTRIIYAEVAVLVAVLVAAGVLYARNKREN